MANFGAWHAISQLGRNSRNGLDARHRVKLFCRVIPDLRNPNQPRGVMAAAWLRPYVRSGALELLQLDPIRPCDQRLRLVIPGSKPGTFSAIYDTQPGTPLFERIFSDRVMVRRELASDPLTQLGAATAVDIARFDPPESFAAPPIGPAEGRQLERDFEFLRGRKVERLIVRDPYLFHFEDARRSFEILLAILKGVFGDMPAAVQLHFAEETNLQKRQICEAVMRGFRSRLPVLGIPEAKFHGARMRGGQDFHDRRIEFTIVEPSTNPMLKKRGVEKSASPAQAKKRITVELSGGIDRLVSEEKECCLYRFESA
jgi:hypothetical protein